ncbi:MAG: hypothetical protein HN350_17440 [Phycisphaerales bacterium]|jgi:hypothetical protein|nr:hypothetical protein [Phycisphaerales bacterium]
MTRLQCGGCGMHLDLPDERAADPGECPLCGHTSLTPPAPAPTASQKANDIGRDLKDNRYIAAAAEGALAKRPAVKITADLKVMGACSEAAKFMAAKMIENVGKGSYIKALCWTGMGAFVLITGIPTLLAGNVSRPGKLIGFIIFGGVGCVVAGLMELSSAGNYRTVSGLKQAWFKDLAELRD